MYVFAFTLGFVVAVGLHGHLCTIGTPACTTTTLQTVPVATSALAGLILFGWKFLVVHRVAKQSGESPNTLARRSRSPVRRLGLSLLVLALGWLVGALVRLAIS